MSPHHKKRENILIRQLSVFFFIIIVLFGFLFFQNLKSKKHSRFSNTQSYSIKINDRVKKIERQNQAVNIVRNKKLGVWENEKSRKEIKLQPELIIGEQEENSNMTFFQVTSIIADREGNIYVCEFSDCSIKKFDEFGGYIKSFAEKGSGPGELYMPSKMAFDNSDHLNVIDYGNRRINKYSEDGSFINSVKIEIGRSPSGFAVDDEGHYYISAYDQETDKTIQKFSPAGKKIITFGEPVHFQKPVDLLSRAQKVTISQGPLVIYKSKIYYSQRNPYEIRIYSLEGQLETVIFRENDFILPMKASSDGRSISYEIPPMSIYIGVVENKILNVASVSKKESKFDNAQVFDLFNLEGELLTSITQDRFTCSYIDDKNRLYGILRSKEGFERIVRYKLLLQ